MTTQFQAGIGPGQSSCHIYRIGDDPRMSLCNSICIARNYRGPISFNNTRLCRRCFTALQRALPQGSAITAELIGVSAIED